MNGSALPHFEVHVVGPGLEPWLPGNTGVRGFTSFDSGVAGPHVCITALAHGNEIVGAVALDRLLRDGVRPRQGRLTLGFINLAAYARFDPRSPTASRLSMRISTGCGIPMCWTARGAPANWIGRARSGR